MPEDSWNPKPERQYEHIESSLKKQRKGEHLAEEIAARTVEKERARHGAARESGRASLNDLSSGRRGGLRSHEVPGGRIYSQHYGEARALGLEGRSRCARQRSKWRCKVEGSGRR
ncbi:hypothetical protein BH11PSE8_BH11PSE8_09660 [soil metagenome]